MSKANGQRNGHKTNVPRSEALTVKQTKFLEAYITNGWNGTEAAKVAGYSGNRDALAVHASMTLRNHKVRRFLEQRMLEAGLTEGQITARLSEVATASIAWFLDKRGAIIPSRIRRYGYLVREYEAPAKGKRARIKLHNSMEALGMLAKIRGMFQDRVELTGEVTSSTQSRVEVIVVREPRQIGPAEPKPIEVGAADVSVTPGNGNGGTAH